MNPFTFILVQHLCLACGAGLLFLAGVLLALPVVKAGSVRLTWLPLTLFRMVHRALGTHPGMIRLWVLIFGFNGTAMALYMASGVHPVLPAAISLVTGYNLSVILLVAGQTQRLNGLAISPDTRWKPAGRVAVLCGLAVVLLELPCFWYSIAMGIRLGQEVVAGRIGYLQGVGIRLHAYALLILPVLFVSAVCEAIAIRGTAPSLPGPPQGSGVRGQGSGAHPSPPRSASEPLRGQATPSEPQHPPGGGVGS